MNDLDMNIEEQLKAAFDEIKMPQGLRERTLAAVEAAHEDAEASESRNADNKAEEAQREMALTVSSAKPAKNVRRFRVIKHPLRFASGIAACLVIALAGLFGYRYISEPTAFVDIDINPSIELAVNRFDNVIGAEAINDDARAVIEQVDIVGKPYAEAIEILAVEISRAGYSIDDSFLEFSITSDDMRQTAALESSTDAFIATCGYEGNCNVVDASVHEAAHACNMGVGKYLAAQELTELDPDITMEECSHMSMRQIRDGISACHQRSESDNSENPDNSAGNGQGYGNGQGTGQGTGNGAGYGQGYGTHHGQNSGQGYGHQRHHSE